MPTISGIVYDGLGNNLPGVKIRGYRRDTGQLIASAVSSGGGLPFNDDSVCKISFDYIFGNTIPDDKGTYSATTYNNPTQIQGIVGASALQLNGSNQYISLNVKNNVSYNAANGGFALSFWVRRVQDNESSSILLKANDAGNNPIGNRLNLHFPWSDGKWYWDFGSTSTGRVSGTWNSAWYNNWIHVVAQYTTTNRVQLFVNGVLQGETDSSANPQTMTLNENIWFGYYEGTTPQYVNASIDEIRMFERELTLGEISTLYTEGSLGLGSIAGEYVLNTGTYTGEVQVLFLDPDTGTLYNDIVHRVNVI